MLSHLTKIETSLVIRLNSEYCYNSCSKCPSLAAHMREDVHATRQLHYQLEINLHRLSGAMQYRRPLERF